MNFFTDMSGFVNYDVSVKSESSGNEVFTINLERINLNDIKAYYNNRASKLIITGVVKNGRLKSRISGGNIDFTAKSDMQITRFQLYNTILTKTIAAGLDITLHSSKKGILFKKGLVGDRKLRIRPGWIFLFRITCWILILPVRILIYPKSGNTCLRNI